jgi:hypothetical protein
MVADGLMEREELREKLACSYVRRQRRSKVRELSRETILARYREAAPEELEMADGKERCAVYNTLGSPSGPRRPGRTRSG